MGTILVAMPRIEDSNHLIDLIRSQGRLDDIETCRTAAEVLRISNERDYGVVICTKRIFEMEYFELSGYLPKYFGMIIMTKDMSIDISSDTMVKLTMPFKTRELLSTLDMMLSFLVRNIRKKKKIPPKRSNAEQKIINEAKALLMNRNGMTEPEAFRYIQKCSMDSGRSMVESAQMVLML